MGKQDSEMSNVDFKIKPRRALIVYIHNLKMVRQLKRYGSVDYISKRMHYVVMYTDDENIDDQVARIRKLQFVRRVQLSKWPEIDPELSDLKAEGIYNQKIDEDDK